MTILNSKDEKVLRSMGIDPATPADHNECHVRWLEERSKRCIAEEAVRQNAQAYEKIREGLEDEAAKWEVRAWRWGALCLLLAGLLAVAVMRIWVGR